MLDVVFIELPERIEEHRFNWVRGLQFSWVGGGLQLSRLRGLQFSWVGGGLQFRWVGGLQFTTALLWSGSAEVTVVVSFLLGCMWLWTYPIESSLLRLLPSSRGRGGLWGAATSSSGGCVACLRLLDASCGRVGLWGVEGGTLA